MDPYYILKVEDFDITQEKYSLESQITLENVVDEDPTVFFKKGTPDLIGEFYKYDLHYETKRKVKGRAYGNHDPFSEFIFIDDKTIYFYPKYNLLILHTNNKIFESFLHSFSEEKILKLTKVQVEFDDIVDNINALGITNLWLTGSLGENHLTSVALNGQNVNDSQKYKDFRAEGSALTNVTILYKNIKNNDDKIMITVDGGIIFYHHHEESNALQFVVDCYEKFILLL